MKRNAKYIDERILRSLPNAVASSRFLFVLFSILDSTLDFINFSRPESICVKKPLQKQGHKYLCIIRVF